MLKYLTTKDVTYQGKLYKGRKIIGTEETLALIYPLRNKAIFTHGWRSEAQQAEMVKKGASKTMDSNHCRGVAYDIWNWQDCEKDMRKLGFINDLKPWDPGHFPFGGEDKARKSYKIIYKLPAKLEEYKPAIPVKSEKTKIPVKNAPVSVPKEQKTTMPTPIPKIQPAAPQTLTSTNPKIKVKYVPENVQTIIPIAQKTEETVPTGASGSVIPENGFWVELIKKALAILWPKK